MAFVTEGFGNFNSRTGYAPRLKKSLSIRPGTLATGVAVVAFAWVAATLVTTQSMMLSLPRAATTTNDFLTPRASAFIVSQSPIARPARLSSQVASLNGQGRFAGVPATAPATGSTSATTGTNVQTNAGSKDAIRSQLAYALTQQASQIKLEQSAAASIKSGRIEMAAASPETLDRLRKVIAVNFAAAVQSLAQVKYAAASIPSASPAKEAVQPIAVASAAPAALPAIAEATPLPARDADIAMTQAVLTVVPMARPARDEDVRRPNTPATAAIAKATVKDTPAQPPARLLAYADPDDSSVRKAKPFINPFAAISPGSGTAIYDIEAKTVYLPSGERLEAHSGLGHMRDNPRYVDRKNTGPTPPETYKLTYRESLFHGVRALRLTPTGGGRVYGRDGLLAHTYMLRGGRAESNGCVVFKDYNRFLAAFKRGEIKHLKVVSRMSSAASVASAR
ncbi:tlde1 domain-containing protein [Rhizobium sp. BR 314]|uniref:tlde1 domain-containing protein n=1 Tax=Rhizobium sp. BR 314 TaxID=3040013 RepID=UPI0039BFBA18